MYRTTSVLALGLFLGLAPAGLQAQTQTETQEPTAQQETQQQDQQLQDEQLQTQEPTAQQDQQLQPDQERTTGLLATDDQSLLVDTMIGSRVYSPDDEDIGSISDVLITVDGEVGGVVIGVGGWLGVGQRDVLVSMQDLSLEISDGELRLVMQRTREELEAEPEFRRADVAQRDTMMQQDTMQQQDQAGIQQDTTEQDQQALQEDQQLEQDQQALQQAEQALQEAEQAIQQGDAERARQSLAQARDHLQQAYEQAQPEQQQALDDANQQLQQAEQAIDQGETQQAQEGVEQAREQLQLAMTDEPRVAEEPGVAEEPAVERPEDGQIVFQDERSILASTMIGSNVHSETDEDMGQISDIIVSMDGQVEGVVIGVGGFLGIGEKDVVIGMDRLDIQRTDDDQVRVSVLETREDLEAAPGFERPQQPDTMQQQETQPRVEPETEDTEEPTLQQ